MHTLVWNDCFATGFATVDAQHRHLFELINRMGALLGDAVAPADATIEEFFREMAAYAALHFKEEENLMRSAGVAAAYFEHHARAHRDFIAQLKLMWSERSIMSVPEETIHGFLAAWLGSHILGEDQEMAREVQRARGAPEDPQRDRTCAPAAVDVFRQALDILYHEMTRLHQDLAAVNRDLQARVAQQTRELVQAEKMVGIGQLAAGVAHEINNPIGFLTANLGTLEGYLADLFAITDAYTAAEVGYGVATPELERAQTLKKEKDYEFLRSDIPQLLAESREGLARVRRIVASLKDFARVDETLWQEADLLAGLESTLGVAWHQIKDKADIVRELQPLPPVRCMPALINQVLLNLLVNAAQAIDGRGIITLRSGCNNGEVWIEVADTGCGMDETTQHRLFDPFFTTKPVGTGTGLGMALAYDIIVNKHRGRFAVDSAPGRGTRIRVVLPRA